MILFIFKILKLHTNLSSNDAISIYVIIRNNIDISHQFIVDAFSFYKITDFKTL